jgi:ribonuclease HII
MPDFALELSIEGNVCGLDEVGRGPLAGPVVAACVYVPPDAYALPFMPDIRDSKTLNHDRLVWLDALIREHCVYAVAEVAPEDIDRMNIFQASLHAMASAMAAMRGVVLHHALVDGKYCPPRLPCASTPVIKGDGISTSIAAASILAKVHRDAIMRDLAVQYPHYGWERNVGYPTKAHMEGIDKHGITPHHRRSFSPVRNFILHGRTKPENLSQVTHSA